MCACGGRKDLLLGPAGQRAQAGTAPVTVGGNLATKRQREIGSVQLPQLNERRRLRPGRYLSSGTRTRSVVYNGEHADATRNPYIAIELYNEASEISGS